MSSSDDCGDNSDEVQCDAYTMCSFEGAAGMCGWSQDEGNEVDWKIGQGGLARDHTLGLASGHYIFVESSFPTVQGARARITSPVLKSAESSCQFRFYWHMKEKVSISNMKYSVPSSLTQKDTGSINVYARTTYGGQTRRIWSNVGEGEDFWTRADLNITDGQPFLVVLEAVIGDGHLGDIAIDDTSFTPGCLLANADPIPSTLTPDRCAVNNQFICLDNSQCIDREKVNYSSDLCQL